MVDTLIQQTGCIVVSIGYTLAPNAKMNEIIDQVTNAVMVLQHSVIYETLYFL
jgi:acetyl esterase/lipase